MTTVKLFNTILLTLLALLFFSCQDSENLDDGKKPESNRFSRSTLTMGMDEPMAMSFLPGNKIIIVERKGDVKIFDEESEEISTAGNILVNTKYKNKEGKVREAEEGLMGVIAHPEYATNNWIFLFYADPEESVHKLSRYVLKDLELDLSSEIVLLEIVTQREECCHTGGGMVFDAAGNLFLSVGNNTVNPRTGASNMDERIGFENADDQRGPSNTNDLRGKILKIHPEDDGTYSIPDGNLFPAGTEKTRPEIYTMGHRNPWRVSLDSETGYLYWGEVGPDANVDSIWGPKGYDEFNQAKGPGFFGWPYFVGNNRPYNAYDAESKTYGKAFDPDNPVNNSRNNTGINKLPKPVPAFIYYPYGPSPEFPLVGSAGRSATGGPIYRKADFPNAERAFPSYYDGKWLMIDFMRDWIMSITMDENGDYVGMERFLPEENFSAVIDIQFGPSGDLYLLEYGDAWFRKNSNSQLVKLSYNKGNRKPLVKATASKYAGGIPFETQFSSEGTIDYDAYDVGKLKYDWAVKAEDGTIQNYSTASPKVTIDQPGNYKVSLTVTDTKNESNKTFFEIVAGNEKPVVNVDFKGINQSFYFGDKNLDYTVAVSDAEDGTSQDGKITAEEMAITFDYVPSGFDPIEVASHQAGADLLAIDAIGKNLIESSDCVSCHQFNKNSIGPSYEEVAKKYAFTPENKILLRDRIINGASGIWGDHAMAAHPELSEAHAERMVNYIMIFMDEKPTVKKLALKGSITPEVPDGEDGEGVYVLRAAYTDKGMGEVKALLGEQIMTLRNPVLYPANADIKNNTQYLTTPRKNFFMLGDNASVGWKQIDLTGIERIDVVVDVSPRYEATGGIIEVRLGSPNGKILGTSEKVNPKAFPRNRNGKTPKTVEERKARRRKNSQLVEIPLIETAGLQDVYIVVKNESAKENVVMMGLKEIEFMNEKN